MTAPRVLVCKPTEDYRLWLRFEDGLQGDVYLGNLVDLGAFRAWENVLLFMTARPDAEAHAVVWPAGGVRLDTEILYHDLLARGRRRAPMPQADAGFRRFMARALAPVKRRRK